MRSPQPSRIARHVPELPLGAGGTSHTRAAQSNARNAQAASRKAQRAFTLIELMVSIAVTAILILAVNQVFSSVSDGVARGLALSEVMATARIIGDQIEHDFEEAIGPGENGVLAIVGHSINAYVYKDDPDAGIAKRDVRSDQVLFIRRRGDADPVTPQATTTYDGYSSAAYVKVWYGHPLRAEPITGQDPGADLGASGGINEFALNWILGRQALFLNQDGTSLPSNHARGGTTTTQVVGIGSKPVSSPQVYHGVTDVAQFGLDTPNQTYGCMVGTAPKGTSETLADTRLQKTDTASQYAVKMYKYMYVNERLLCNPTPGGTTYEAWQIAQMHPYLAGHVSDFVVEFAGDYDSTSGIDKESTGEIKWYGLTIEPAAGAFVDESVSAASQLPIYDDSREGSSSDPIDRRYVFRHGSGNTNWPYMLRFRYRIHDARGKLAGPDGDLGIWFEQIVTVPRK